MANLDPTQNPDAQEALSRRYANATVLILPLRSGRFAIIDRGFNLHDILDEAPSADALRLFSLAFAAELKSTDRARRAEAEFYGEPSVHDLARDLKRGDAEARKVAPIRRPSVPIKLELDLDL